MLRRTTTRKKTKAKTNWQCKMKRQRASDAKFGKLRSIKKRSVKPWALKVTQNPKRRRNKLSKSSEEKNPRQNLRVMRSRTQTTLS